MADDRELRLKVKVDDQASKPLHSIGDSADGTTKNLEGMNVGLKKLDKQVDETKRSIGDLRKEVASTGDLGLLKDIQKQEARLKAFERQKKSLVGDGEKEADGFAAKFTQRLGPLLASAPVSPPMLAAFAGAGVLISPLIAGAVTAGVGLASVGAGLKLAFSDPEVAAAGKSLGDEVTRSLKDSAQPFVPATLKAIKTVRTEFRSLKPDIDALFADSAKYVEPLTRAVTGFVKNLLPGLEEANRNAGPLIETLGEHGPKAGEAFGSALRDMSKDADNTASALDLLLTALEGQITTTGLYFEGVNKIFPYLGTGLLQLTGVMDGSKKSTDDAAAAAAKLAEEQKKVVPPVQDVTDAAKGQVGALDELAAKMREETDPMFGLIGAQQDLAAAQRDYTAAVKEHGRNSPAAQEALRKEALAALAVESATGKAAGSFDGKLTPAMKATLKAAGFTETQIADLENQFKTAKAAGDRFAKTYKATVVVQGSIRWTSSGDLHVPGGTLLKKAGGGPVVGPGPKGVDSVPILAAPGEEILSVPDVDAMGGHAAVERMRRQLRSGAAAPAASSTGGGGTQRVEYVLRFDPSGTDRSILGAIIRALRDAGGHPAVLGL